MKRSETAELVLAPIFILSLSLSSYAAGLLEVKALVAAWHSLLDVKEVVSVCDVCVCVMCDVCASV